MKIKSLNSEKIKKWGFPLEMEYDNKDFHGHKISVAVCLKNDTTGVIEENFLSEGLGDIKTRDALLLELLNDKDILLVKDNITQFDKESGKLVPKTMYYVPYYVADHSVFKPTVDYENVSGASNVTYELKVEILFVYEDGLSRYVTLPICTRNTSIMDYVYSMFENYDEEEFAKIGLKYRTEKESDLEEEEEGYYLDDDEEEGYYLDFYNEVGQKYYLCFSTLERLRDSIASLRLIEISYTIDEVE